MTVNLEEEVICDYRVSGKQKKIWNIELGLLEKFMEVCNRNNLKFFVAHGTLLGAVRHGGFIPWDDDIDVNMPRKDYESLKKIAPKEFQFPFFFQTFETDPFNFVGHAKLRNELTTGMDLQNIGDLKSHNGLFIDIFPMDGVVEDLKHRKKQSQKIEMYRGLMLAKIYGEKYFYFQQYNEQIWKKYCLVSKIFSAEFLNKKFEKWCSKYTDDRALREGIHAFRTDYECCYWYKKDYEKITYMSFQGMMVPVPENYDNCLKIKWGNYMEYPPSEKRGYKHNDVIMEPDVSFHEFAQDKFQIPLYKLKEKKIILFGAGNVAETFMRYYGENFAPQFLLDNNSQKWGGKIHGVSVENPEVLMQMDQSGNVVIITSTFFKEIEEQLINMGWKNYYIYLEGRRYQ